MTEAISVNGLGKGYKHYPTNGSRLLEWVLPWMGPRHHLKWVLKEVNFSVKRGESVGVMGVNGAGKSTLLKIIAGTVRPTTGRVDVSGRVVALLELGMGFHPDFTGRQNVLMAGQLLGYKVNEIERMMPAIESFAEIGDYIDQPVRVYSSGMQMRLAFSVATASRPEVLIVDEALSVGDAYFQHKSFERIRQFRDEGTTLLLVSHDKTAIQSVCERAILLDGGAMVIEGDPEAVLDYYNGMLAQRQRTTVRQEPTVKGKVSTVSGSGEATIKVVRLLNDNNEEIEVVGVGQAVRLQIIVDVKADLPDLVVGYMIKDRYGQPVFGTNTHHLRRKVEDVTKGERIEVRFSFEASLGEGSYSVAVALHSSDTHLARSYEWRDLALVFDVVNMGKERFVGVAWIPSRVEWSR